MTYEIIADNSLHNIYEEKRLQKGHQCEKIRTDILEKLK